MSETIKIAVVGCGTVGTGVVRLLTKQKSHIERQMGRGLHLKHVVVRQLDRARDVDLPDGVLHTDLQRVLDDREVSIVLQLVGGVDVAEQIILSLLRSGKDVVTANKALLAARGAEVFAEARSLGRSIAFEAAVAGGIPIIGGIGLGLSANRITSLRGILNGTCNYIVSQMEQFGRAYDDALAEAQQLGFAEADPTMDVDGTDAAQKLAILAQLAFHSSVHWEQIPRVGIQGLQQIDMQYAAELGYRIKLLAVASVDDHQPADDEARLDLHVTPTLVRQGTPLAEVRGANNAISVVGDAVGRVFFHGLGAGQMPTASAVVADLIDMAIGRTALTFQAMNLWTNDRDCYRLEESDRSTGRFYLRSRVEDRPGVLAEVSGAFSMHGISIASVIQHEPSDESAVVDLVVMTHQTTSGALQQAAASLQSQPFVRQAPICMRVLD